VAQASIQNALANLTTLLQASRGVGPPVGPDVLLERIEQATLQVIGCERVTVFLSEGEMLRSRLATGERELNVPAALGIVGEASRTRQIINVPDVSVDPRFNPTVDRTTGFRTRSLLAAPLIGYDQQLIGVFELLNKQGGPFTAADEEMTATLASLAAIALQCQLLLQEHTVKRKLDRDLAAARKIQRSLLPATEPVASGFDIAGWNKPAEATGGDFYDYLPLGEGRLGLVLADVTGHGLGASLLACECRALVRALASMTSNLTSILTRANEILHEDLKSERFVTLFLGELDVAGSQITYVSAGHAPLYYCPRGPETCRRMSATTLPLGIQPSIDASHGQPLTMKSGDILMLITDGFDEWENIEEEPFGTERIFEVIRTNRARPAEEIIKRLHERVADFSGGTKQEDDLTAMVVKKL
jgi:phosphoserine phosphatase